MGHGEAVGGDDGLDPWTTAVWVAGKTKWVEQLTDLVLTHGVTAFLIGGDHVAMIERFAAEVAPAVRELVTGERA